MSIRTLWPMFCVALTTQSVNFRMEKRAGKKNIGCEHEWNLIPRQFWFDSIYHLSGFFVDAKKKHFSRAFPAQPEFLRDFIQCVFFHDSESVSQLGGAEHRLNGCEFEQSALGHCVISILSFKPFARASVVRNEPNFKFNRIFKLTSNCFIVRMTSIVWNNRCICPLKHTRPN